MKKRIISAFLAISMLISLLGGLSGCGEGGGTKAKTLAEGVLGPESLTLSGEGVSMTLSPVTLDSDVNGKIEQVPSPAPLDDIEPLVYEFSLDGMSALTGVIDLTIPLELGEGEEAGAAYYNAEAGQWEPVCFRYDAETGDVVITTDHLSKYGVFSVSGEGTRRARIAFLGLYGDSGDEDYMAAVEEFTVGGVPASKCIDIGSGAAGDALQLGGDFLGNIVQSAGYLAYGEDVISSLGDYLGNIGLLLSVVQISTNIYRGKINDALAGSMKTAATYIMGKVASKLSSAVMSASMASIAFIDYSINKFGTAAIEGRASIYRDAYSIYYQKGQDGYRSSPDWYNLLYPLFSEGQISESELNAEVDKLVTDYCAEFWGGANKLGVDYYVSEARDKLAWTGGEAGLSQATRDEISAERRAIIYNDILPGVCNQITRKLNLENERWLREAYQNLTAYLNTTISFSFEDPEKTYAGYIVRFAPLNDNAVIENWTGKIKSDGTVNTSFTLYGHMLAGSPDTFNIYEPDADPDEDDPVLSLGFTVTPPAIELTLGSGLSGLQYESGSGSNVLQAGFDAALKELDTISVGEDGSFTAEVEYASASGGSESDHYTIEVSGFSMSGTVDPHTLEGRATFSYTMSFVRKEISALEPMPGNTLQEYVTGYFYDDSVSGTAKLSENGGTVTLSANMTSERTGYTKLIYHSIDTSGKAYWGDNPTITDKSGERTDSGTYTFTVLSN
ncbi:MAG: hypothetical protein AB7D36_03980 [Oscillospiraceae bacterium]